MRSTGEYATYNGKEHPVVARGADSDGSEYVGLLLEDGAEAAAAFQRVVDRPSGDRMAKVLRHELDRYEQVTTVGRVDGADVTLYGLDDPVPCYFVGDPAWADTHGFTGSQHDGWDGSVPLGDISDIRECVKDLLTPLTVDGRK